MARKRAPRRTREFWKRLVEEFEAGPAISHREFCENHQVTVDGFRRWLYRIRRERRGDLSCPVPSVRFVEIVEAEPALSPTVEHLIPGIRVTVGAVVVETPELPSPQWLVKVAQGMEGGPC